MVLLYMDFINFIIEISGQNGIAETVDVMMFFCEQRAFHVK